MVVTMVIMIEWLRHFRSRLLVSNEQFEQCPPRTWFSGFIGWAVVHGQYSRVTAGILRLFVCLDCLKRLVWLLQYDINQICPDFYFRLIIIGHCLLCHYCGTILVWSWWETSLIIWLGFVISWLSRFVLKIYSGDLTFKIIFATVALLAVFNDHVAWVWISLNLGNSDTSLFFFTAWSTPTFGSDQSQTDRDENELYLMAHHRLEEVALLWLLLLL